MCLEDRHDPRITLCQGKMVFTPWLMTDLFSFEWCERMIQDTASTFHLNFSSTWRLNSFLLKCAIGVINRIYVLIGANFHILKCSHGVKACINENWLTNRQKEKKKILDILMISTRNTGFSLEIVALITLSLKSLLVICKAKSGRATVFVRRLNKCKINYCVYKQNPTRWF